MNKHRVFICLVVTSVIFMLNIGTAMASTSYSFLRGQWWAAPKEIPVVLGTLSVTVDSLQQGTSAALFALPSDFDIVLPGPIQSIEDPLVILVTSKTSKNEFMGTVDTGVGYQKATFLIPISTTIPRGYSGDIEILITNIKGQFSNCAVVAGSVLPGEVSIETRGVGHVENGESLVNILFSENMAGLFNKYEPIKLILPEGLEWASAKGTLVSGKELNALPVANGRLLEIRIDRESTGRAVLSVESVIKVTDTSKASDGEVRAEIQGMRGLTSRNILVAYYETSKVTEPVTEEPRAVFSVGSTSYVHCTGLREMDVAPYVRDGRVFIPLRFVAASLDVDSIEWNGQEVTLVKAERVVQVVPGNLTMMIDGKPVLMDIAAEIIQPGRVMLPYRYIAEAFGAKISWDNIERTVTVTIN